MERIEPKQTFTLQTLLQEGVVILKQPTVPVHVELDLSSVRGTQERHTELLQRRIKVCAELCAQFVAGPVITDSFQDHGQRRLWRQKMSQKYGQSFSDVYESNKLRINNLGALKSWMETVAYGMEIFGEPSDDAQSIIRISQSFPDLTHYDELTTAEKVQLVEGVDKLCKQFISVFQKA